MPCCATWHKISYRCWQCLLLITLSDIARFICDWCNNRVFKKISCIAFSCQNYRKCIKNLNLKKFRNLVPRMFVLFAAWCLSKCEIPMCNISDICSNNNNTRFLSLAFSSIHFAVFVSNGSQTKTTYWWKSISRFLGVCSNSLLCTKTEVMVRIACLDETFSLVLSKLRRSLTSHVAWKLKCFVFKVESIKRSWLKRKELLFLKPGSCAVSFRFRVRNRTPS